MRDVLIGTQTILFDKTYNEMGTYFFYSSKERVATNSKVVIMDRRLMNKNITPTEHEQAGDNYFWITKIIVQTLDWIHNTVHKSRF